MKNILKITTFDEELKLWKKKHKGVSDDYTIMYFKDTIEDIIKKKNKKYYEEYLNNPYGKNKILDKFLELYKYYIIKNKYNIKLDEISTTKFQELKFDLSDLKKMFPEYQICHWDDKLKYDVVDKYPNNFMFLKENKFYTKNEYLKYIKNPIKIETIIITSKKIKEEINLISETFFNHSGYSYVEDIIKIVSYDKNKKLTRKKSFEKGDVVEIYYNNLFKYGVTYNHLLSKKIEKPFNEKGYFEFKYWLENGESITQSIKPVISFGKFKIISESNINKKEDSCWKNIKCYIEEKSVVLVSNIFEDEKYCFNFTCDNVNFKTSPK